MNEVQKFILTRAMNKVANKGIQKEANPLTWIKDKYNNSIDWLSDFILDNFTDPTQHNEKFSLRELASMPKKGYEGFYTTEDPAIPFTKDTPVLNIKGNDAHILTPFDNYRSPMSSSNRNVYDAKFHNVLNNIKDGYRSSVSGTKAID